MSTGETQPQQNQTRTAEDKGAELVDLLQEQLRLYEQLAALAEVQHSLVSDSNPEKLLNVLGDRQKVLRKLEQLAGSVRSHHRDWPELRSQLPAAQVEEVDSLLRKVNRVLAAILERDKVDSQTLAARKEVSGQDMQKCKKGRQAGAAYAAAAYQKQSNLDWKGE